MKIHLYTNRFTTSSWYRLAISQLLSLQNAYATKCYATLHIIIIVSLSNNNVNSDLKLKYDTW